MISRFQIRCDGEVLGDLSQVEYAYLDGNLKVATNNAGTLSFKLMPNNPIADSVKPLKSTIQLIEDGRIVWVGRVVKSKKNILGQREVTCEGALSWLHDIYISLEEGDKTVPEFINQVVGGYNSYSSVNRGITVGVVEEIDRLAQTTKSGYHSAFDYANDIVVNNGGSFVMTYNESAAPILNYYRKGKKTDKELVFGDGMTDINELIDTTRIVTSIVAQNGTDGSYYVFDNEKAVETYGRVMTFNTFEAEDSEAALKQNAMEFLQKKMLGVNSMTVTSTISDERYEVGDLVRVRSARHGIDVEMIVSQIDYNLNDLSKAKISFGTTTEPLTKKVLKNWRKFRYDNSI